MTVQPSIKPPVGEIPLTPFELATHRETTPLIELHGHLAGQGFWLQAQGVAAEVKLLHSIFVHRNAELAAKLPQFVGLVQLPGRGPVECKIHAISLKNERLIPSHSSAVAW